MRDNVRMLRKNCEVGKYKFDIAINRQIVLDGFEQFPELWKIIVKSEKEGSSIEDIEDVKLLTELLDKNDEIEELTSKFVQYILPKMVELAGEDVDCDEFYRYCVRNDADQELDIAIFDFAMLGFTDGKGAKKPKVKVSLK